MKADVTVGKACDVLSRAGAGQLSYDAEFKASCVLACRVMRQVERLLSGLGVTGVETTKVETPK